MSTQVQIFGTRKCADTRKAQRFFAERRMPVHFVDLQKRAASPGELRRFAQKFGVDALVDRGGKRFEAKGLKAAHLSDERWLERLADDPLLLRTPLVRYGKHLTIGHAPEEWGGWAES